MLDLEKLIMDTIAIVKSAGSKILERNSFEVEEKGDVANIVTSADLATQEFLVSKLNDLLPEAKFIAEENNLFELGNEFTWVIDPIDGTTNFAYDLKHSCISVGLLYEKKGYLGIVYNPYLDELFVAAKNKGAYLNGEKISVSDNDMPKSLMVVGTSPYVKSLSSKTFKNLEQLFLKGRDLRRSGSAALDLCYVACGRYDGFYEGYLSPWDYTAAGLIIEEAGGIIDAISPDTWGYEKPIGVIAGNKVNFNDIKNIVE